MLASGFALLASDIVRGSAVLDYPACGLWEPQPMGTAVFQNACSREHPPLSAWHSICSVFCPLGRLYQALLATVQRIKTINGLIEDLNGTPNSRSVRFTGRPYSAAGATAETLEHLLGDPMM